MKFELANSTGFTVVQHSQSAFSEALYKITPSPVEDTSKSLFSSCDRKDQRIRDLIKKASTAYTVDSMVRQAVDKYSEMFKSFDFEGGDAQVKYLKERLTQMTLQTGEHWETFITRVINEYFKTGNAFIVKRRGSNAKSTKRALYKNKPYTVSGFSLVSPERIEVSRNNKGEFEGWELIGTKNDEKFKTVAPSATRLRQGDALIQIMVTPEKSNVLIPGVDIVQIAYKKAADSSYGFGLTLAALEDISMTRTLEQITAVMIKKFSSPIIHHKIIRPSSPLAGMQQEINMAYELYRRMSPDGILITGGNSEIKAVGSESQALRNEGYLRYFLYRGLTGLGVSPYLFGLEGGGQGTAEAAVELLMMKVRFCQAEIAREIEMFILNELLWEGGFDPFHNEEDQVKLVFEDIDENRSIKLATHAADMFQKNVWGHTEARKLSGVKGDVTDGDLYLDKIDIPKSKAEADAKGVAQKDAGVAIAKARPVPKSSKPKPRTSREVLEIIDSLIPQNELQLKILFDYLEKNYDYPSDMLLEVFTPVKNLLGDDEAIKLLLVERLLND